MEATPRRDIVERLGALRCDSKCEIGTTPPCYRCPFDVGREAADTIDRITAELDGLKAFLKEVSNALLKVRPLGGSELFVKRFDDYYADPAYCGAAIEEKDRRYHEAMKGKVIAERERDALKHDIERHLKIISDTLADNERLRKALEKIQDEAWTKSDLQVMDCKVPEMVWQSVARRALATLRVTDADGKGGK